jgi:hypothetical protein
VTVNGSLTPGSIGSAQNICYNATPAGLAPITLPSGGSGSYTYRWQSSTDNSSWTNIDGATSDTYAPGALTSNTYYRRAVIDASCGTVYSNSVLITVYPLVTVNAISDQEGCVNTSIPGVTFASPTSGATFKWTNSNPAIGLPATGTGNQPQFTALREGAATITVTPVYNDCDGTPRTYTITVHPCVIPVNPHLRSRSIP